MAIEWHVVRINYCLIIVTHEYNEHHHQPIPISPFPSMSEEGKLSEKEEQGTDIQTDLFAFHEQNAGRLIVDPGCVFLFILAECC